MNKLARRASGMLLLVSFSLSQVTDAVAESTTTLARTLARLIEPPELLAATNARSARTRLDAAANVDPALRSIRSSSEEEYRGIATAVEESVRKNVLAVYPELEVGYCELYEKNLANDELIALIEFFRGPLGSRAVAEGISGTMGSSDNDRAAARSALISTLTPNERTRLLAFLQSAAGRHLTSLHNQKLEIARGWSERHRAQRSLEAQKAITAAADIYEQRHPAAKTGAKVSQ